MMGCFNRGSNNTNVFVSGTDKSVRWYRDHVGLTVGSEPHLDGRYDRQFSFVRSVIRPVYVEVACFEFASDGMICSIR